jgi:glutamate dehydrogenase (NAD(P)+)
MEEKRITVLLIEDNPVQTRLIQNLLAAASGPAFEVEATDQLQAGLDRVRQGGIDLVCSTSCSPTAMGSRPSFISTRRLRRSPWWFRRAGRPEPRGKAVEGGAQDYLVKGQISGAQLTRSIRYALERARARSGEWASPMFRLAQQQFLKAAQLMELDDNLRQRLLFPQRTLVVSFPFRRDGYEQVETVFGYRVQHVLSMGPTKGGIRYHPRWTSARSRRWRCG